MLPLPAPRAFRSPASLTAPLSSGGFGTRTAPAAAQTAPSWPSQAPERSTASWLAGGAAAMAATIAQVAFSAGATPAAPFTRASSPAWLHTPPSAASTGATLSARLAFSAAAGSDVRRPSAAASRLPPVQLLSADSCTTDLHVACSFGSGPVAAAAAADQGARYCVAFRVASTPPEQALALANSAT